MDDRRFDTLARSFTSGTSRRRFLRGMARGLLAAIPFAAAIERSAAAGLLGGEPCIRDH